MAKKEEGTGLSVYEGNKYALIQGSMDDMSNILAANIGDGNGIDEFNLDRVGMPGSGGLAWSVPDINGEPEPLAELVGVILLHGDRRAYWKEAFDKSGGGSPPDCSSLDARVGIGYILNDEPGDGNPAKQRGCKTCPMAQWGSADPKDDKNNGQACSARKILYLIREGDVLPLIVDLAPTSVGVLSKFMLRLTSRRIPCYGAVVGLKLKNENSANGIKYSVVVPRVISLLNEEDTESMRKASETLRPFFDKTGVEAPKEEVEVTVESKPVNNTAQEDAVPDPT